MASNDKIFQKASTMTQPDIVAECRAAHGSRDEISDACARAIVRLHGENSNLWVAAFVLRGELPADDEHIDGGTKLWRMLFRFRRYNSMSPDDRLMARMLGTYFLNGPPPEDN